MTDDSMKQWMDAIFDDLDQVDAPAELELRGAYACDVSSSGYPGSCRGADCDACVPSVTVPVCDACGGLVLGEGADLLVCDGCGRAWRKGGDGWALALLGDVVEPDPVDLELPVDAWQPDPICAHGAPIADCDACYVAGDLAFDARRERS